MPGLGDNDIDKDMTGITSIDRMRVAKSKKKGLNYYLMLIGGGGMLLVAIAMIVMSLMPAAPPPAPIVTVTPTPIPILTLGLKMDIYPVAGAHDQRVIKITHTGGPAIRNISSLYFNVYGPEEEGLSAATAMYDPASSKVPFASGGSIYIYQTITGKYVVSSYAPSYDEFVDLANGDWGIQVIDVATKYGVGGGKQTLRIIDSKTHYVHAEDSIKSAVATANWYDTIIVTGPLYRERMTIETPVRLFSLNASTIDGGNLDTVIDIKSNDVEVAGFEIKNSGNKFGDGVVVVSQAFSGAKIYNNEIHHGSVGIWLWGADKCIVDNNIVYENDKQGILLENGADHNIITNNRVDDNGADGIRVDISDYNEITRNDVNGNEAYGIIIEAYETLDNICEYNTGKDTIRCNDEADRTPTTPVPTPVIHSSLEDDIKNFRVWTNGPGEKYSAW